MSKLKQKEIATLPKTYLRTKTEKRKKERKKKKQENVGSKKRAIKKEKEAKWPAVAGKRRVDDGNLDRKFVVSVIR